MKFCPKRVVLLEQAENALFEIDRELRETWAGAEIRAAVGDICDEKRVGRIFEEEKPDVVFHCAAHKHVPMMESSPGEAVKNNVFGTKVMADAAVRAGSEAFVMVSTDKAVNPTSVMGATKRCAELYTQSLNERSRTRFVCVRFGNVLASSGSVVPIFRKQIEAGGPVTVTHPDMRRYFMTIPEASQLVMQAGAIGKGGEIFVLDMGEPVRILDLARAMILQAGLVPDEDISIKITGIRPGEKLYEELAKDDEQTRPTCHPKIRVWKLNRATRGEVERMLRLLGGAMDAPREDVITVLRQVVLEYGPREALPSGLRLVNDADRQAVVAA
jgi:FlaA1/EpsC-like NDP-sugar epimerase